MNAPPNSETAALAQRLGFVLAPDLPGDAPGPLAGVKAALTWAASEGAEFLATAPCDTPLLPDDLYPNLGAEIGDAAAAIAETPDGPQALCGLWRVAALPALAEALAGGRHPPVREALAGMNMRRVLFAEAGAFANLNTPDDLAALAARRP
ncbi:MAG: NTP transferase domain-containing protein [Hyphomonadaceae bacterium]|nr:NTP transferase domain-containing protein [Hyphomonadaceae bacterium]